MAHQQTGEGTTTEGITFSQMTPTLLWGRVSSFPLHSILLTHVPKQRFVKSEDGWQRAPTLPPTPPSLSHSRESMQ